MLNLQSMSRVASAAGIMLICAASTGCGRNAERVASPGQSTNETSDNVAQILNATDHVPAGTALLKIVEGAAAQHAVIPGTLSGDSAVGTRPFRLSDIRMDKEKFDAFFTWKTIRGLTSN